VEAHGGKIWAKKSTTGYLSRYLAVLRVLIEGKAA
jgi:hypothetical protein